MFDKKIQPIFSPRGMGSVNEYAGNKVQDDYIMISIDVLDPRENGYPQ